ncbi:hypothetical protein JCM11491_002384 [Sporobolomyces phaffii]
MATSPFKRRPNLSKTYASRTAVPPASRPRHVSASASAKSDVAKLLLDSSEDERDGESSTSEASVGRRLLGRSRVEGRQGSQKDGDTDNSISDRKGKRKSVSGERDDGAHPKSKRTSSSRTKSTENEDDSTIWDERAVNTAPSRTRARRSEPTKQAAAGNGLKSTSKTVSRSLAKLENRAPSTRRTSPRKSAPTPSPVAAVSPSSSPLSPVSDDASVHSDPPSPPSRKRRKRPAPPPPQSAATEKESESAENDKVPPPFDYVPPRPRLRSSPLKERTPSKADSPLVATQLEPRPGESAAPLIRTILPSSSSPSKDVERTPPRWASPLPSTVQALRPNSAMAEHKRPPSPAAKDLSSLFSSFSKPDKAVAKEPSGNEPVANPERGMMRRNTSGGVVASLAAKRAGEGTTRASTSRATTPVSPERPARVPLDRSLSQPSLSSPLSSPNGFLPFRSPQRPNLGTVSSLPDILSPQRIRIGSASPTKDANIHRPPAVGSVYRPVSFSVSASTTGYADGGRTRTYGGSRSFRSELETSAFTPAAESAPTPATERVDREDASATTTFTSPNLPTLPPSISNRLPKNAISRETYSQLREKWGVAAEEALDESEEYESLERGARVIGTGTLRAQGEGKRWSDEMGWTLDGLREGKGGSGARSSAIELLGKTLDREWTRRLKSSGMAEQVYLAFRRGGAGDGDRVLDVALVVLLASFSRDQRLSEPLFRLSSSDIVAVPRSPTKSQSAPQSPRQDGFKNCDLLETLVKVSTRDWVRDEIGGSSTGRDTKATLTKTDTRHLQALRDIIDQSKVFEDSDLPITLRTLLLHVLQSTASFSARPIFQPQQLLCTSGAFEAVVETFLSECAPLSQRIDKYTQGLDLLPPANGIDGRSSLSPSTVFLCLSIFEATSLSTPYAFQLVSSTAYLEPLSRAFFQVASASSILAFANGRSDGPVAAGSKLLLSILGILFGLSTEAIWSDALIGAHTSRNDGLIGVLVRTALACRRTSEARPRATRPGHPEAEDEVVEDRPEWDTLCLVLGTLTNLIESADAAKDILRETLIDPNCQLGRKCIRSCACPAPQPALTILAQIYLDPLDDAPNSVHKTSVAGFLRLLLGLALVDNPRNETLVIEALSQDASSSSTARISAIVDALDEFAKLHEEQTQVRGMMRLEEGGRDMDEAGIESRRGDVDGGEGDEVVFQQDRDGDLAKEIRSTIARLNRRTAQVEH